MRRDRRSKKNSRNNGDDSDDIVYTDAEKAQAYAQMGDIERHVVLSAIVEFASNVIIMGGAVPWRRAQVGYSWRDDDSDFENESEWEEERYQRKREKAGYKRTDGRTDSEDGSDAGDEANVEASNGAAGEANTKGQ